MGSSLAATIRRRRVIFGSTQLVEVLPVRVGRRWRWIGLAVILFVAVGVGLVAGYRDNLWAKRVVVVVPGRIIRGAWQRPGPLREIVREWQIRTIVTLTAINEDDPKYVDQAEVVRETGVGWKFVRMKGSRATLPEMAEAADLIADPANQPVFFHCVAGHHRSNLAQAAYRIRYEGWSAQKAWAEVAGLGLSRTSRDVEDHRLIEAFAASRFAEVRPGRVEDEAAGSLVTEPSPARRLR